MLFSGGLDSMLATKLLANQGIEVTLICFVGNFFNDQVARQSAKTLGLPLRTEDISEDFLAVLKKPKHGFGAGLNPCVDCHVLMLKKTTAIMRREKFDLVATGEVLGERPMSQHKQALKIVEQEAGLADYLLRPLSAKLLEPTIAEKQGLVDREKLLDISGRSRQKQMALAVEFGFKEYPSPAGGCALTQAGFAGRLKELMKHRPDFTVKDAKLVGVGRHFFIGRHWFILGRDKEENEFLKKQSGREDVFVAPINFPGPEALIRGQEISEKIIKHVKELIIEFASKAKGLKEEKVFEITKK